MTVHAREAWSWIEAHRALFQAEIDKPWVISATNRDIDDFSSRAYANGEQYDDIGDHLMFNFNSPADITVFSRQHFTANICLSGSEYLDNNLNFQC
jgi:hypothetical protein